MTESILTGLRIDAGGDQFPVSDAAPRLSWLPAVHAPKGYELAATVDDEPLATATAAGHRLISWPWRPLRSGERIRWRVRVPEGQWSDEHAFEVGLLDADWTADWISPLAPVDSAFGKRPGHSLRRTFRIDRPLARARLYATALGVYEAFVNGERAGTAELSPGSTSYDATVYAQAADVTASLVSGDNTIEIVLTDGWYQGQVGAFHARAAWTDGDDVGARAELHLHYEDGASEVVRTDGQWALWTSPIIRAGLMDGQATDLTVEPVELQPARVGIVAGPPVSWSPAPPVRRVEERTPVSLTRLGSGAWIADFGQNASGWTRLTDLGPRGSRTVIEHGEHLSPVGDLDMSHLDSEREGDGLVVLDQRDEVVSDGTSRFFEPRHTVHGFQYARVTRGDLPLTADDLSMQVVNTDLTPAGSFRCSDDDLNRLYEIADWSFRGNAVDIPTDCPQRERIGWTGDYQVFVSTAVRLFDVHGFSRKWLQSVRDDQLADGRIANFSPDGRQVKHHPELQVAQMTGSAGWGDAIVHVPWVLYETYGDRDELAANWNAMSRWVEWALDTARTRRHPTRVQRSAEPLPHEQYLWDGSFHWGEWCEPKERAEDGTLIDPLQDNPMAWFMEDKGEVGTAYLYRSTATLARIASILGREGDAARYADIAERVREAWRTEFLRQDGRTDKDTQAAYVRALSFDLIPDDLRPAAADRLVALIRKAGTHLGTGFLSTADLLPTLVETGHADVAYELLFQRTSPSWLGMLDRGATTIWEDWDGVDEHGHAFASLNHYSKGAVVRFLHTHVLGLDQAPGSHAWESFVLRPVPGGGVTWAEGSYVTPQGTIEASWRIEQGVLTVSGHVPAATSGIVVLPDGSTTQAGPGPFTVTSIA